jgi:putative transposase
VDLVKRNFQAECPNKLRIAALTYVANWTGIVYAAFEIDVFSRRMISLCVAMSMRTARVLDALVQAIWSHFLLKGVVHHSDKGSRYLAIR